MINNLFYKKKDGFLVLTMVLLVSITILAVLTGILLRSISDVSQTADSENALKAWSAVNACGEYALEQMIASSTSSTTTATNWNYAGDITLSLPLPDGAETCYIYPVVASGTAKLIRASSTISRFTRKILIEVATNTPTTTVSSWSVVADFDD